MTGRFFKTADFKAALVDLLESEQAVGNALGRNADGDVQLWNLITPEDTQPPFSVYSTGRGGQEEDRHGCRPGSALFEFKLDLWCSDPLDGDTRCDVVAEELESSHFESTSGPATHYGPIILTGEEEDYDEDTESTVKMLTFQVQATPA